MYSVLHCIGMPKETAVQRYLEKVGELEMCSVTSYRGFSDDQRVSINIGSRHVHITDMNNMNLHRSDGERITVFYTKNTHIYTHVQCTCTGAVWSL